MREVIRIEEPQEGKKPVGKTRIRIEVLNLTMDHWAKVDKITFNGYQIEVTPQELVDLIGVSGGNFLTAKLNAEEKAFVDAYHSLSWEILDHLNSGKY